MTTSTFITDDDRVYLTNNFIDPEVDLPIFLRELRTYLNEVWEDVYFIVDDFSFEELNSRYLENYPSTGGYYILEDTFTTGPTELLSERSKFILGYLYNIHLR